jgi:hypothetical protein
MESLDNQLAPNLPKQIPILMAISDIQGRADRFGSMFFCDKYLSQSWTDGSGVFLNLSEIPNVSLARGGLSNSTATKLWSTEGANKILLFDFCPASGRLCVMTTAHEIRIIDYLIPT